MSLAFSVFDDERVVDHVPPRRLVAPVEQPAGVAEAAVTGELQHA